MPPTDKLRRWIDLIAALLSQRTAMTFAELARKVPAYLADGSVKAGQPSDTLKRMFERDKVELREQGVPIETVGELGEEESAYTLRVRDFYLPYLGLVTARGVMQPRKVDRFGYGSIQLLAFEPDELAVIADAAARVLQVGDRTLADDVRSARRKLAFDLPLGATEAPSPDDILLPSASPADSRVLSSLGAALFGRKRVTCAYHSMGAVGSAMRTMEPYGLFFVGGHWYLAARDVDKDALRNFRVSRMDTVKVNDRKKDTPDYEIPADFTLREHAKSRKAWELGDVDSIEAVVEFRGESGAARAARALGEADVASEHTRRFAVRRVDSFARWLLSFAGDAVPVAPASLVQEYQALVKATLSRYSIHG